MAAQLRTDLARVHAFRADRENVRAEYFIKRIEHFADAQFGNACDGGVEVLPEVAQELFPVQLAVRHQIQLLFEAGGEVVFDIAAEELLQEGRDQPALVLGDEAVLLHLHIFAVAQHGQDRGIGRRTADPQLFHLLDQAGFRIARRRLGEVLVGLDRTHGGAGAFVDHGQAAAVLVAIGVALLAL